MTRRRPTFPRPLPRPSSLHGWVAATLAVVLVLAVAALLAVGLLYAVAAVVDPRLFGTSLGKGSLL